MAKRKTTASTRKTTTGGQSAVMSVLEWFGTLIVLIIPILGIVLYIVWAFASDGNANRRNYCRAALIMMAISLALGFLFSMVFTNIIGMLTGGFGGFW